MTAVPLNKGRPGGLFSSLRDGFAFVAQAATHVRIDQARLEALADELPGYPPFNLLDPRHHFTGGSDEDTAAYILALDSLNFGSGYKPALIAEGTALVEGSIYYTISTRLKEHFEKHGALRADDMAAITAGDIKMLLNLKGAHDNLVFAGLCARALTETGRFVRAGHGGQFMALVDSANGSAEELVTTLTRMKNFNDEHAYKGRAVAFHKRAQIAAADLELAFGQKGRSLFRDMAGLTLFADNAVPHVLRVEGVLEYTPALAARIAAGAIIASGSPEEIEIRGCAAQAVELIAARKGMDAVHVDHILWHRSAEDKKYKASPTHRTRSWFY